MFARLTGHVTMLDASTALVDVGGVGYRVACSARTLGDLMRAPQPAALHVETQVREDQITLFGFATREEHDWFLLLTSVQGVGGKVALALLSALSPVQIADSLAAQDAKMLTRADGVGPKLAGRIVNELKDKVARMMASVPSTDRADISVSVANQSSALVQDALSALANLGFERTDAYRVVMRLNSEASATPLTVQQLIALALKELSVPERRHHA